MALTDDPPTASVAIAAADEQQLIAYLQTHDEPCPLCRYNLRGLLTPRCPECGNALRLGVSVVEPYLAGWIALVAGLFLPAGLGLILIVVFVIALMRGDVHFSYNDLPPLGVGLVLLHIVLSVPLSVLAIVGRRRFMSWPRESQTAVAGFAWAADAVSLILFLSQLR